MAYDVELADKVQKVLAGDANVSEKKMFGGVCFLLSGNMICGVLNQDLIVRVGPKAYEKSLSKPHTRVFDITGRVMKGWVMVAPEGYQGRKLKTWVEKGYEFAAGLPPKSN